ncbi:multicopper oxidase family protein [Ureibacillus terrenus]|uniref:Multicopper oxidase family protein n=1 Tax=Ureibacillus terrenus TaxID=118246 RepID=A0A540V570_9BACL|nr:multicopper oxidase [Ureibacillus terrenus]MED3662160.1 multicopper oxidase [Ureibacillus terrenus]MED3764426.1 multicopper oxidase [Ureibacillus terrenus]TQE91904.1 multicopper oxidase family protein [Ureibacillus terrenus]
MAKTKVNPKDPSTVPKFVTALKKPSVAKPKPHPDYPSNSYFEIVMKESLHRFHRDFPLTKIWGYDGLYPGPTIEARKDKTIYVKYVNRLPKKHFLPVDRSLHGVGDSPEVRSVVHVHGAHVDWESDGHPEAWYTQNYEYTGPKFRRKVHKYTNHQPAATLWYHDHTMAMTRLNVYAGLTGFYLIRDALEDRLNLPKGDYEYPLLIQDKSFNEDGSLFYPDRPPENAPFPIPAPFIPTIVPFFNGDFMVVNGKVWPYLDVEPRKYRFRILNGSNGSTYRIQLDNGAPFHLIGTDGGFLTAPVEVPSIDLMPAERVDVIVDFSKFKKENIKLINALLDETDPKRDIMLFRVIKPLKGEDTSEIPAKLAESMDLHEHHAQTVRKLPLSVGTDQYGRIMMMLDNKMFHEPCTEKPALDSIEIWEFINATPIPHPIHIHLIQFQILDRRPFNVDVYQNSNGEILEFTGDPEPPLDFEKGWKDTVRAPSGMVTRVIMHWKEHAGNYIWHCHLLEHEDHDMMRPIKVVDAVSAHHPQEHDKSQRH